MSRTEARVVGAGLIGTSIALRLQEIGWSVEVSDSNPTNQAIAEDLLLGRSAPNHPQIVVVATPPNEVIGTLKEEFARTPNATFIDVSSTKSKVQLEVEGISGLKSKFVGTHPIAGREAHGPQSARSDLFEGRAWILTPGFDVPKELIEVVKGFISSMGATAYEMSPQEHDSLFARISHLPQILSTALASSIDPLGNAIDLAGQGLRDMLRLAGSDGGLWGEILISNSEEILNSITDFRKKIDEIEEAIQRSNLEVLVSLFREGNEVHKRLSGKHGSRPREYTYLNVIIEDKPGRLGALFNECAAISANVEDLTLEHSPRQESGLIRLALSRDDAERLNFHLIKKGWTVHIQ